MTFNHWKTGLMCKLEFEGHLPNLCDSMGMGLNPSMDNFKINKLLGKGRYGEVYECTYSNGQYAVKTIDVTNYFDHTEPREVSIMSCLQDANIVTFYQAWCENKKEENKFHGFGVHEPKYIYIHMEACARTLYDFLCGNNEGTIQDRWSLFERIVKGVRCIHATGIIHRDLKPWNIFLGPCGAVRIGDLGHGCWSKSYCDGRRGSPDCGTMLYSAPELRNGLLVTDKVDVYSLGVIYLEIFMPAAVSVNNRVDALIDLMERRYKPEWTAWSIDMEFLKDLTALNPCDRPSVGTILEYIAEHASDC
ncbi:eIF-2-alpha kinase GCN2-like [Oryza sativa Japonica Group]|uniref:non-specific serine/threonine protein kinase n=3 Tax=Oryza TaxID=4527 RepID=A0A8J8Y6W1_ORYSJ|nr:eIF-2-alpha kinase GCN2-like [Oryza sativa Japonica Group]ABF97487.1 Protein kinase domain containing protein [Oryza sativa Japonica Group]EAZ27715.1 hypothetical protein OsJ_11664 [Oryza sativa Japonica Group]KAF2940147.1 hypothetical protein DAI22_03g249600 [Oryza sativa Japonica Group]